MNDDSRPQPSPEDDKERPSPPKPVARSTYQGLVDQRIAEAEAQGHFRNLPGAGRPLKLDDDSNVPEADRAAFRMLKHAGFAPPWIELQKTIDRDRQRVAAWLARVNARWSSYGPLEQQRLRDEYQQHLRDLARLIEHYNLTAPQAVGQLPALRMREELARLGQPV